MHSYCYKVLVETVVIKGGGTQLSLGVKSLIGDVGPPASRYIWDNLVLIKNHLGNLLKVQIPWSPSQLTLW